MQSFCFLVSEYSADQDHRLILFIRGRPADFEQVEEHYEAQSNYTIADQLEGKLLIAHGDLDDNVPLPASIKLVDALIKADKDFDFLVMPGRNHGFGNEPYFVRYGHERASERTQLIIMIMMIMIKRRNN